MRIALFTDTYLPTVNGVARALGLLVEHAAREGHEVALVTPPVPGDTAEHVPLHLRVPGVEVPFYPELHLCRPWLGRRARSRLGDFRPDVVHAATEAVVGWLGRRWALRHDVPLVTSYCTHFADYAAGYRLGFLERPLWAWLRTFHAPADRTVAPSRDALRALSEHGFHDRLGLWPRGVDSDGFHPGKRSPSIRREMAPGAEVVLLYVGRIAPEKRVHLLLDAFPGIRRGADRPVGLVLVGDGPALHELRDRKVEGVTFTGYRRGSLLAATYASADLFLFPSDTETFGQVVTEAFASGLPVVAAARGGVTDLVEPGRTGDLFRPGDAAALTEAALPLVRDDGLRWKMGRHARLDAEGRSWAGVFRDLFSLYRDTCTSRNGTVTVASGSGR